jgi:ABC-type protease/lipase transport system fused ATPase/permease subunit
MGTGLSGGQMQRITLARALYGDPKLVVLDEPGSNLDQQGISALQQAIREMRKEGCTVVMATHQQSLLSVCDRLFVLHPNGSPSIIGPTEKVLERLNGFVRGQEDATQQT